ncbi:MAG: YlbG family protein [Acholeplasmataceae bacterium]|jgi:uncharacterized protein YlbG (UPF0298 family)|nr:YlbG family protein [Acholeplasmataceae bacterium]
MVIKRECYLIYYRQRRALKRIRKIKGLDIFYVSKRFNYLTVYLDKSEEKRIINELKQMRGIRSFEKSLLDQPEINLDL